MIPAVQCCNRCRHVGHRRRVQHFGHHHVLFLRDHPALEQHRPGPARGIEFDRQIDQLKHDKRPKQEEADQRQWPQSRKHDPHDDQDQRQAAAGRRQRHQTAPQGQRRVFRSVLNRVPHFMGRDPQGGERPAVIHVRAQPQHTGTRGVVIPQERLDRLNLHVADTASVQDGLGRLRAAEAAAGFVLGALGIRRLHPPLRPHRQQDRRAHVQEVHGIPAVDKTKYAHEPSILPVVFSGILVAGPSASSRRRGLASRSPAD